ARSSRRGRPRGCRARRGARRRRARGFPAGACAKVAPGRDAVNTAAAPSPHHRRASAGGDPMTRALSVLALLSLVAFAAACDDPKLVAQQTAPPPTPKAPEAKAGDGGAPKPKMVANSDGLSLAERIAKREAAEKKLAAELAQKEHERLLAYDRTKM